MFVCIVRAAVVLIALAFSLSAQTNVARYRWATGIGGIDDDFAFDLAADSLGSSYITGHFAGNAEFPGTSNLTARGSYDVFVAKFDKSGRAQWAVRAGGTNVDNGFRIGRDGVGNLLVTGAVYGDADFPGTNVVGPGGDDCFVAKFTSNGQLLWVRQAGGSGGDAGLGIAADASDNCLVTGYFRSSAAFGATNLSARGESDAFIAKYTQQGDLVWVRQVGGAGIDEGRGIAVGRNHDVWATGDFASSNAFATTNLTLRGVGDIFVARYDPEGQLLWVTSAGGTNTFRADSGASIAVDAWNNSYVCGTFHDYATFGSTNMSSVSQSATFLAKYDSAGSLLWVRQNLATSASTGIGVALDDRDTVTICGLFVGTVLFGTNTLRSFSGQADSFLARYTSDGDLIWVVQSGGPAYTVCYGISMDIEGRVYSAGWFRSGNTFGGIELTNHFLGGRDAYIARIDPPPILRISNRNDGLIVSWPAEASNFFAQRTAALRPTNWQPAPSIAIGERRMVTNASSGFYRLVRQ
jgi:hypothetical protein